MVDLVEIKSVKIVPYVLMTSSISAVWGFIFAILFLISAGATLALIPSIPTSAGLGSTYLSTLTTLIAALSVSFIVILPVFFFIYNIIPAFLLTLIYNLLVPRLGGIQLKIEDLSHIKSIPVVPFALIISAISAVFSFIIALIQGPYLGAVTSISSSAGMGILVALGTIILTPIVQFIVVFIITAITIVFYNVLSPMIGGIKLNFVNIKETVYGIDSISIIPFALITAAVAAVWGLIAGIIALIFALIAGSAVTGVIVLIGFPIGLFIGVFILDAIFAFIYNFLAPRIGSVKLELE